MLRIRSLAAALAGLAFAAAPASALPPIYDRVPAEAVVVVSTQNLGDVDRAVTQMFGAVELPALATPSELLRRIGLGEAVDLTKPAALALMPGDLEADVPPAVLLLPTTNFAEMMNALGGRADGAVFTFDAPTGETLFARSGDGGYAVVGMDRELVAAVDGRGGNAGAHAAHVGPVGRDAVEGAQLAVLIKKPMLDLLREQIEGGMQETLEGMAMFAPEGQAEQMRAQAEMFASLIDTAFTQGQDLALTLDAGASGVSVDMAMDFTPGSDLAGLFEKGGDSSRFLAALPNQPFLLAYAVDYTTPVARRFLDQMADAGVNPLMPGVGGEGFAEIIDQARGQSYAIYKSPGGLMGGLLANSAGYFAAANPAEALAGVRDVMKNNAAAMDGFSLNYEPNAAEVDGVSADSWSASFEGLANAGEDPMAGAMVQQFMTMLFGPSGPGGYVAPAGNGLYMTLGLNSRLLSQCFNAEKGQGSLRENRGYAMVAERLPADRAGELYVGVGPILEQALQLAAMFGAPVAVDLPPALPPIGMAVTTGRGGTLGRIFVPAPVIKVAGQLAQQADGMMNQGADDAPPF
ncbi:MAG: hypothetical protein D6693_05660 [Planctomycetota bacterium]|nr:MAG: hypothetical protein D6693_05660 [Planctomycetota bacterium]